MVNRVYGKERYTKEHFGKVEEHQGSGGQLHLYAVVVKQEVVLRLLWKEQETHLLGVMFKGNQEHLFRRNLRGCDLRQQDIHIRTKRHEISSKKLA